MRIETIIIGAGQAGLALSRHLRDAGRGHVLLERGRVGERWRSERWDSLRMLTPNWLNRLPGAPPLPDPDGFLDREGVIAYLEEYAAGAPVRDRTTVQRVRRRHRGYHVATDRGDWLAANVVIATGDCDVPYVPMSAPPSVHQLHATRYRRPEALPPGRVLVVGAGPTGQQLALELRRAGREVVLSAGRHTRMPRTYRGRDVFAWLHDTGTLDVHADDIGDLAAARRTPSFAVSGEEPLGLDRLAGLGVVVTGRLEGFDGREARFDRDLGGRLRDADRGLRRTLARFDAHIDRTGGAAGPPDPPPPVVLGPGPERVEADVVLWATGYRRAYPWLDVPVLDAAGELVHDCGITPAPGLFALGLRFQRTRRSHLVGGVGRDALYIAEAIGAAGLARVA